MNTKQSIDYIISICKQYIDEVLRGWGLSDEEKSLVAFEQKHMPYTQYSGNQSVDHVLFRKFLRTFGTNTNHDVIRNIVKEEVETKQDKTDNNLTTTDKTIVGAVNEVQSKLNETTRDLEIVEGDTATLKTEVAELQEDLSGKQDASKAQEMFEELAAKTTTPIVLHDDSSNVVTIQPNVMNVWGEVTDLTITKDTDTETKGIVNNYMIRFTAGEGTPYIRFDWGREEIQWYGGNEIEFVNGNTYEISIVNNIALWAEFEPKAE